MALVDITNKIITDAETEAKRIVSHAESEAARIRAEAEKHADTSEHDAKVHIEKTLQDNERKIAASATQEVKMSLEAFRSEGIATVFERAQNSVVQLDDAAYEAFLHKLVESLPNDLHGTAEVPEARIAITKKVVAAKGLDLSVTAGDVSAGLKIESDVCDFNLTIESLLARIREQYEVAVAEILFTH